MEEIWKAIPGYEGRYEASTEGRIRSVDHYSSQFINNGTPCKQFRRGKILKGSPDQDGYFNVDLYDGVSSKAKTFRVSRLVALTFLPNPNNYSQVDHLNCIVTDNRPSNLEWVNCKENISRVYKRGRNAFIGKVGKICKCVEDVKMFISVTDAAKYYSVHPNRIYTCLSDSTKCVKTDDRILHFEPVHLSKNEYTSFIRELSEIANTKETT